MPAVNDVIPKRLGRALSEMIDESWSERTYIVYTKPNAAAEACNLRDSGQFMGLSGSVGNMRWPPPPEEAFWGDVLLETVSIGAVMCSLPPIEDCCWCCSAMRSPVVSISGLDVFRWDAKRFSGQVTDGLSTEVMEN